MKRFLLVFLALICVATPVRAATGLSSIIFTNANKRSFIVDLSAVPTNQLKLNLRGPLQPDGPGDIWTWMSTNVFNLWTNDTIFGTPGILKPQDAVSYQYMYASNYYQAGWHALAPQVQLLSLAVTNTVLASDRFSSFQIISLTNDASYSHIQLTAGSAFGQDLLIMCDTNTSGLFTLSANSPVTGGGVVRMNNNQDWTGQQGAAIDFVWMGVDWWERGRWIAGTTNTPTTITINPTIGFLPEKDGPQSFRDSPLHVEGTNLISTAALVITNNSSGAFIPLTLKNLDPTPGTSQDVQMRYKMAADDGTELQALGIQVGRAFPWPNTASAYSQASFNLLFGGNEYSLFQLNGAGVATAFLPAAFGTNSPVSGGPAGLMAATSFFAATNAPENSGAMIWRGSGWNSTNAAAESVYFGSYTVPSQVGGQGAGGELATDFYSQARGASRVFSVSYNSGYTGTGANAFYDDGTFKPAPGASLWTNSAGTLKNVGSQQDLQFTGNTTTSRIIAQQSGGTQMILGSGGSEGYIESTGTATEVKNGATAVKVQSGFFVPSVNLTASLGGPGSSTWWLDSGIQGTNYIAGYINTIDGVSESWMEVSHTGTNGFARFNSIGTVDAGPGRPYLFQFDGTNALKISNPSGYTGAGTLVFTDDGTFKSLGSGGLSAANWTASGPTNQTSAGIASMHGAVITNDLSVGGTITANLLSIGTLQLTGATPSTFARWDPNTNLVSATGSDSLTLSNLTANGQNGFTGFTVANLPTGIAAGYQTYCTDCLTPWGTGDRVEWDGSVWKTMRSRITATTSLQTYFLNALGARLNISTPITSATFQSDNGFGIGSLQRQTAVTGAGASAATIVASASGSAAGLFTGTTTNGTSLARGLPLLAMTSTDVFSCGGLYSFQTACTAAELFWARVGIDSTGTAAYPASGCFFLYDMFNVNGHGLTGSATNNWICVTGKAGSYTYADSGLPVNTSNASTFDRLMIQATTNNVYFYTNGVLSQTLNTFSTIPTANLIPCVATIIKTNGVTNRQLFEAQPFLHYRLAAARTLP